jgi:hypothetical protein
VLIRPVGGQHDKKGLIYFLKSDAIQIISAITIITAIIPTTAPALKMPAITEQLLKQSNNKISDGKYNLFITGFSLL